MKAKDGLGRYGEKVAISHLVANGVDVIDRNWRCRDGEIDIVAREGPVLVFCEVKARSGLRYGDPVEAVPPAKAERLRALALLWIAAHRLPLCPVRFDVIAVLKGRRGAATVRHLRGAF